MNYFLLFCQTKLFRFYNLFVIFVIFFWGCSSFVDTRPSNGEKEDVADSDYMVFKDESKKQDENLTIEESTDDINLKNAENKLKAIPVWFKVPQKYSHHDSELNAYAHAFFDLVPHLDVNTGLVNFFPLTPQDSRALYKLDIVSGKRYLQHVFCNQYDVWGKYRSKLDYPNYTSGVIPRLLNTLGNPQEIIVFGSSYKYDGILKIKETNSYRVRIVGGVLKQYCHVYPCKLRSDWQSAPLLIAIDPDDEELKEVKSLKELQDIVDWNYAIAFLQNQEGRSRFTSASNKKFLDGDRPAYRVLGELSVKDAINAAFLKGKLLKFEELQSMRSGCHKLYEYLEKNLQVVRQSDGEKSFATFFNKVYDSYRHKAMTCFKSVRSSNINFDTNNHWEMSYLQGFFLADSLEYLFRCSDKTWSEKKYYSKSKTPYSLCLDDELDYAFLSISNMFLNSYIQGMESYRYITYDFGAFGTHEKIYSWIYDNGKRLNCYNDTDEVMKNISPEKIFPQDIEWKKFGRGPINRNENIK